MNLLPSIAPLAVCNTTAEVRNDAIAVTVTEEEIGEDKTKPDPTILVPFTPTTLSAKGVKHAPARGGLLGDAERASLLTTIARSRTWIDELLNDPTVDFAAIEPVTLPAGGVHFSPASPSADVHMIAATMTLIARADLHSATQDRAPK